MTSPRPSASRKCCAAVVAAALLLQPLGAYAAPITTSSLAEIPLQGLNPIKPNIMFTMDDSGSMNADTLPDYLTSAPVPVYNPAPDVDDPKKPWFGWCLGTGGAAAKSCGLMSPPFASSKVNRIYYDPSINYAPGVRVDATNLPCEGIDPCPGWVDYKGPWTNVYKDGFAGYPGANTGGTTDLTSGYRDEVFCTTDTPSSTDKATAKTDGSVCRYNGVNYGGISGYLYPSAKYSFHHVVTGNPYYYTITAVQFCTAHDAKGWGNDGCASRWTPTNRYISYGSGAFDPTAFVRVEIDTKSKGFLVNGAPATNPSGRSYDEEMANFAIWYTFARTRILAMKTAGGIGFSALDASVRIGFNSINTYTTKFLNINDFKEPFKSTWFTNFYSMAPAAATPTIDAMWRIGEYFSNGGSAAGLPSVTDPLDPVTGKCQPNYHLMSTDGYANQFPVAYKTKLGDTIGNRDLTVPGVLPGPIEGFVPGGPFPPPYREGPTPTSNTMADVAMYYWINDLRPELPNKAKDSVAPWQKVNFYGLAIGAEGSLPFPDAKVDLDKGLIDWPPAKNNTPTSIDDLWHAAVNSRGTYYNAQNAQELAQGIASALDAFKDQAGTGTGVGLASAQLTATKNFGYRTSYEAGWWGDIKKYALNPATGALDVDKDGNPLEPPVWTAAAQLDLQVASEGWKSGNNRRIVTINDAKIPAVVVPFSKATDLSAAQQASLIAGWPAPKPAAQKVLDFLRGDPSNEGVGTSNFRIRTHVLGDFVNSGAVPVGAPSLPYDDAGNPGYPAFAEAKKTRTPMVYIGGNDGMVHAVDDSSTVDAGKESWAFVPAAVFKSGDPNTTEHTPSPEFQIGALAYRRGGIPQFRHKFLVNATPRIWDIDFANTDTKTPPKSGNDWRTILVGGLGTGGRAVYALDVTTPVPAGSSEADIASSGRVLWEIGSSTPKFENLGYLFDPPTLVKTYRYGWVALIPSGYNNKDGKGYLFVVNPKDGKWLRTLSLPGDDGTAEKPTGLSTIRAYTASRKDPYVLQAYGGDLKGRVWRFDLSDPDESKWKVELIAELKDKSGVAQPITTGIRIEIDQTNNVDRYLFVGTGKLLDQPDLGDTSVINTLYVIRDGTRTAAGPKPAKPYSRLDLNSVDAGCIGSTGTPCLTGPPTGRGWFQDASNASQKITTDVVADVQTVVYVFSEPSEDPCEAALTSTLFARDFTSGNSVLTSSGGEVVASIGDIGAIAGVTLIQGVGGADSASTGDVRVQVTTMKGQVYSFGVKLTGGSSSKHRVSWRLLGTN